MTIVRCGKKSKFFVVKFTENEKIVSVPESWVTIVEEQEDNGSGEKKIIEASCLWTEELPESKLRLMATDMKKPNSKWTSYDVQILAKADNLAEIRVKESMVKDKCDNIEAEYTECMEMSKKMRSVLKKKKKDSDFSSGEGLSTAKENTDDDVDEQSSNEKEDEAKEFATPASPKESIFQDAVHSNTSAETMETTVLVSITQDHGKSASHLTAQTIPEIVNKNTWHVANMMETGKWHIVPSFWLDKEHMTCFYPPANEKKKEIQACIQQRREPETNWRSWKVNSIDTTTENYISARMSRAALNADNKDEDAEAVNSNKKSDNEAALSLEEGNYSEDFDSIRNAEDNGNSASDLGAEISNSVNQGTWHVVKMMETDRWHVVPSFWVDTEELTCLYPAQQKKKIKKYIKEQRKPDNTWEKWNVILVDNITGDYLSARTRRVTLDADDRDMEAEYPSDAIADHRNDVIVPEPPPVKKTKITSSHPNKPTEPKISYKRSSRISNAELNNMDEKQMLKHIIRQNEELIKSNYDVLVELKEGAGRFPIVASACIRPPRDIFPIKTIKRLLEIEATLEAEADLLAQKKKLPNGNLTDRVITCFNNQGGKDGHTCLLNIMKNCIDDKVQMEFSFKGKLSKVGFCYLQLYRLIKESVVGNYQEYKDAGADDSCAKWLKGAKQRIQLREETGDAKSKARKRKLEQLVRQEAARSQDV